jgi:hypothetical protein
MSGIRPQQGYTGAIASEWVVILSTKEFSGTAWQVIDYLIHHIVALPPIPGLPAVVRNPQINRLRVVGER